MYYNATIKIHEVEENVLAWETKVLIHDVIFL